MWRLGDSTQGSQHYPHANAFSFQTPLPDPRLPPGHVPLNVKQTPSLCPKLDLFFPCSQPLKSSPHFSGQLVRPAAAQVRCQSDPKLLHSCPSQPGQSHQIYPIHSVSWPAHKYTPSPLQLNLVVFKMSSVLYLSPWLLLQQHPNRFHDIKSNFLESTSHRACCSQRPLYSVRQPPGSLAWSPPWLHMLTRIKSTAQNTGLSELPDLALLFGSSTCHLTNKTACFLEIPDTLFPCVSIRMLLSLSKIS